MKFCSAQRGRVERQIAEQPMLLRELLNQKLRRPVPFVGLFLESQTGSQTPLLLGGQFPLRELQFLLGSAVQRKGAAGHLPGASQDQFHDFIDPVHTEAVDLRGHDGQAVTLQFLRMFFEAERLDLLGQCEFTHGASSL